MPTFPFAVVLRHLASALLATLAFSACARDGGSYTLAVMPSAAPVAVHARWMPFVERLKRESGLDFRLKVFENMAEFEREIWGGAPDFIFSSPIQLMVAHKANGYIPLLRSAKMVAIGLFVRQDSPIRTTSDLVGKKIAFVGNKNICSVYIRHVLSTDKEKLIYDTEYAGSTRNVIINVLLGKSDAGAIFVPELASESEQTRSQLREVVSSPEIAPHPLSAHPRVPKADQSKVTKATLAIAASADGAELLAALRFAAPIPADYARDYRALELIDVKGLVNWGQ